MWTAARRYGALAMSSLSEAILQTLGRRPPYGIVKLRLSGELAEDPPETRSLPFPQRTRADYLDLIAGLRAAREDPSLRALLLRCDRLRIGWARLQELHRALLALRAAGKTVWVFLNQAGLHEYALAAAADRIVLTPTGTLDITGLSSEVTFLSGSLRKLGIEAEVIQMGEYKSAGETFTRSDMSPAHREMVESLLHDLYDQLLSAIAAGRGMEPDRVRELFDRGPFVAREASDAGLVDALAYEDEAATQLQAQHADAPVIEWHDYAARRRRNARREALRAGGPTIGLLHLSGTIKMGESISGLDMAGACGVASVTRDLKDLRERRDVGAVVVRISSPGGSGLASDLIWREIVRTRQSKPVVVSFGDVAASGGYYVAVAGSPVFSEAGTITGSIGVLTGKALLRGLYEHLGVTKEIVSCGKHAALYSDYLPLGDEERQRLRCEAESFYDTFVDKVAAGRQLPRSAVLGAAEGRVWTGRQAREHGLVDQLGGIERALEEAKVLAGVGAGVPTAVDRYPKPRRRWKVSVSLIPARNELLAMAPWLRFLDGERLWAVLPFHFRFF
jgi:protease-4